MRLSSFVTPGQSIDGRGDQRQGLGDGDGPSRHLLDAGLLRVWFSGSAKIFGMSSWSPVSLSSISTHLRTEHSSIDVRSG